MNAVTRMHAGIRIDGEVDEDIVEALQEFLDMAKAGKLRNVAIVAIDDELCSQSVYAHKGRSLMTLCGALGLLTRKIERDCDD